MSNPITISDVAKAAGVGVGTVSRVINRSAAVSPVMRRRVQSVIAKLHYDPGEPHSRPGPRQSQRPKPPPRGTAVELVVMLELGLAWAEEQAPIYASVLKGIEDALAIAGIDMMVRQLDRWREDPIAVDERVIGRLFFGSDQSGQGPARFAHQLPAVWVTGSPPDWFRGDIVHIDHEGAGQIAAEELLRLGHRHCAYLGTCAGSPATRLGYRGESFRDTLELGGGSTLMVIDPTLVEFSRARNRANPRQIAAAVSTILSHRPQATALCLQADMLAPAVYGELAARGLRAQHDLTIITCNHEPDYLRQLLPAPLVIDVRAAEVGERAVTLLQWRIDQPLFPPTTTTVRSYLCPPADRR